MRLDRRGTAARSKRGNDSPAGSLLTKFRSATDIYYKFHRNIYYLQVVPTHSQLVLLCDSKIFVIDMMTLKPVDESKFIKVRFHPAEQLNARINY